LLASEGAGVSGQLARYNFKQDGSTS